MLTPSRNASCEVTLEYYFPDATAANYAGLRFDARSLQPGALLRFGAEEAGMQPLYTRTFPRTGLDKDWQTLRLEWSDIRKTWSPRPITALHFVVAPDPAKHYGSSTVFIRQIRYSGAVSAASTVPSNPTAPVPPPIRSPLPHRLSGPVRLTDTTAPVPLPIGRILLTFAAFGGLLLATRSKNPSHRVLSPLYELNTRTWRSERDANGVIQIGGFKNISLNDLKGIKNAGFNALWLMGIWEIGPKVRAISKTYGPDFQGSPFAIMDYHVASDLGTEQEFRELVQRAHSLRMSVIIDFVPNHMGLDSAWLNDHPEYFIHKSLSAGEELLPAEELQKRYPGYFPYRTPSYPVGDRRLPKTIMVAYGKDPYFYPWIDTAQLDYANPDLRQRMIDVLKHWARVVDGVRCDMAMLILKEQVKNHRHPEMSWERFNDLMPTEFWSEAIQAVKRVNPNFSFLAETYWSMEGALQNLGFDYTYNKPLYEAICSAVHHGHAEGLMNFLRMLGTDFLSKGVHFLENHDEERAMNALGEERQAPAATILCTLPGIALIHQGQMEGRRERLPVQRVVPLHQEAENTALNQFYRRLLKVTSTPLFQEGRLAVLYSNNPALVTYARLHEEKRALVVINTSNQPQKGSVFLIPGMRLPSGAQVRLSDIFFEFKKPEGRAGEIKPVYTYPAAQLLNQGLYVELEPFDAHIFIVEPLGAAQATRRAISAARQWTETWSPSRLVRRLTGMAFTRSSDSNLAANPAGRQR